MWMWLSGNIWGLRGWGWEVCRGWRRVRKPWSKKRLQKFGVAWGGEETEQGEKRKNGWHEAWSRGDVHIDVWGATRHIPTSSKAFRGRVLASIYRGPEIRNIEFMKGTMLYTGYHFAPSPTQTQNIIAKNAYNTCFAISFPIKPKLHTLIHASHWVFLCGGSAPCSSSASR